MANDLPHRDHSPVEKETHLLDYFHIVQRRWRVGLILFLLVFAGVAIKTYLETPIYQSSVTLRVGYKQQASEEVLQQRQENRFSIASELRLLQSFEIAEKASGMLGLKWRLQEVPRGIKLQLRELSAPPEAQLLTLELTGQTSYRLLDSAGKTILQGESGQVAESGSYRALLMVRAGAAGDRARIQRLGDDEAIRQVMTGVSVRELEEGSNLILLSVQGTDPVLAADVANALASAYFEHSRMSKAAEANSMLAFIDQQLASLGISLDKSEQALHEFRIKTGLQRLSSEGQSMVDTAVELENKRAELNLRLERINAFLDEFKLNGDNFTSLSELPGIDEYIDQLFTLRASRVDLLRRYTAAHPQVIEVDEQINQVRGKIYGTADLAKSRIAQELADIDVSLGKSTQRLEQVPEEELELVRLTRANEVNAQLYSYLLQRQQETRITASAASGNVEIIDRAQVSQTPIKPNKQKALGLGLVIGLLFGVGLTFLLEYFDQTIKDEEEIQEKFGLNVLGTIPRISEAVASEQRQLVTHLEPHSIPAESFLALRTNIRFLLSSQKHKTLMLTSCLPSEGKSTIAVNLAATLAQTGVKTLLVGCDLRRPSLYAALDQADSPGLSDLLIDGKKGSLRRLNLGFDFIPGGTEPPNPTQLLSSARMKSFLDSARQKYDLVILDVPPLIPVTDALILSALVDLNLLVIEPCRIPEKLLKRAIQLLHNNEAEIAGVVINDKSGKGGKYYGGYNYYNSKYAEGYYRRSTDGPKPSLFMRVMAKIWRFING